MSVLRIPVRNDLPAYQMSVELDGENYDLLLHYMQRPQAWYLSLSHNGVQSLNGIRLVTSRNILAAFRYRKKDRRIPAGTLMLRDITGQDLESTRDSLGVMHVLLYETAT